MPSNSDIGSRGENLAARHLSDLGFTILEQNVRIGKAEIDIVAQKDELLLFVEVKTRSGVKYGHPEEAVGSAQEERILNAAEEYIFKMKWEGRVRFDIISIELKEKPLIHHFEDAFG